MRNLVLHETLAEMSERCMHALAERTRDREDPEMGLLVSLVVHQFARSPDNAALIESALRQEEIRRFLTQKAAALVPMAFALNVLQPLILRQLHSDADPAFVPETFDAIYGNLEAYLSVSTDEYLLTTPLDGFTMDRDKLTVGPFVIRKLTPQEVRFYGGFPPEPQELKIVWRPTHPFLTHVAEMRVEVDRGTSPSTPHNQDLLQWLEWCLKLAKTGSVALNETNVVPLSWSGMSFTSGRLDSGASSSPRSYKLADRDAAEVVAIWEGTEPYRREPPGWILALRRFGDAAGRVTLEDALIDYWIACESLFGSDTSPGDLTYRLSLRIAHFLEADVSARADLRGRIKKAYSIRSAVVHGNPSSNPGAIFEATKLMETVTRRALRKVISSRYRTQRQVIQVAEQSING